VEPWKDAAHAFALPPMMQSHVITKHARGDES